MIRPERPAAARLRLPFAAALPAALGTAWNLRVQRMGGRLPPGVLRVMANPAPMRLGLCVNPAFPFKETFDVSE